MRSITDRFDNDNSTQTKFTNRNPRGLHVPACVVSGKGNGINGIVLRNSLGYLYDDIMDKKDLPYHLWS